MDKYKEVELDLSVLKKTILENENKDLLTEDEVQEKRNNLIEEYKILQAKIDTYGAAALRLRSIIFPLIPALLFFSYKINFDSYLIKILVIIITTYWIYSEVISLQAKNIFQERIKKIEDALKDEDLFLNIEIFNIVEYSSLIGKELRFKKPRFWKKTNIYIKALIPLLIVIFFIYNVDLSNNKEPDSKKVIYNINIDSTQQESKKEIINNLKIINDSINMNNEVLQDISNCCFSTSDK